MKKFRFAIEVTKVCEVSIYADNIDVARAQLNDRYHEGVYDSRIEDTDNVVTNIGTFNEETKEYDWNN